MLLFGDHTRLLGEDREVLVFDDLSPEADISRKTDSGLPLRSGIAPGYVFMDVAMVSGVLA